MRLYRSSHARGTCRCRRWREHGYWTDSIKSWMSASWAACPTCVTEPMTYFLRAWWFPQDPFDLDGDVDAVADHDTTAFKRHVEPHAEVAAVQRARRGEPGSLVAVRVGAEPVDLDP